MNYHVHHQLTIVIQDSTHVATKLRNRLLKEQKVMVMGVSKVSVNHLKALVRNVQKSIHGLTYQDVYPVDKMNYGSFAKIIDPRVIEALKKYVNNCEATIQYLRICEDVTSSYLQLDMTPVERIFRIWRSVYFLRIWRQFILSSKSYTLQNNFITTNAYTCVEINAKNLILLIKKFRDQNTPEQFLTTLFDSQSCEKAFRQFRSMGTTKYTKINFSLYELLFMIGRVEVLNHISYVRLAKSGVNFPHSRIGKTAIYQMPTDEIINDTLCKARDEAMKEASKFGMTNFDGIDDFQITSKLIVDFEEEDYSDDEEYLGADSSGPTTDAEECVNFDIEGADSDDIDENSPLIAIYDVNNTKKLVPKRTFLWMLCEPAATQSNDRNRRFYTNRNK